MDKSIPHFNSQAGTLVKAKTKQKTKKQRKPTMASSSSTSTSSSHASTGSGSGGGGGAARLEASEAMDRDLLNSFGDSIGGVDNYNNNMPNYNAMMMMNHMSHQQPPMLGNMNMYDLMNSGQFGQYLGLLPQGMGSMISPQGMPFTFPYPMPSPQVAHTAAAMTVQQQQQYSHPSQFGQPQHQQHHLMGGKPNRGTKRDHKNADGTTPMPPLNKRKVVASTTADRQDRKKAGSSSSSSSYNNQDNESVDSSNGGKTTTMTGMYLFQFAKLFPSLTSLTSLHFTSQRTTRKWIESNCLQRTTKRA